MVPAQRRFCRFVFPHPRRAQTLLEKVPKRLVSLPLTPSINIPTTPDHTLPPRHRGAKRWRRFSTRSAQMLSRWRG